MKLLVVVLLLCLLAGGTVSAVAINPASVGAAKTIVPVSTQVPLTRIPASSLPGVLVTQAAGGRGMLEIYSVPSGAAVNLDGANTSGEKTPIKYSLPAGTHSVVVYLEGYQFYTETFTLDAGAIKDIQVTLKPLRSGSLAPAAALQVSGMRTLVPEPSASGARSTPELTGRPTTLVTPDLLPGAVTRITTGPVLVTTTPSVEMVCPNADWSCLTDAEAVQQFGYPNARYGDGSCGYELVNNAFVFKYCYMDVPSGSLPSGALAAAGIRKGDSIYLMNKTWIEHDVVGTSPAGGSGNANPFQSVFDLFSGILGGSPPKPEPNLQLVELNPCPEPPMGEGPLVGRFK
jgi:hypothetical protein